MFTVLIFMFVGMAVIGGLSIAFMFMSKNKLVENIFFYIAAIMGMLTAIMSATSGPSNIIIPQIIVKFSAPKKPLIAKIMVSVSVVLGLAFLILM